MKHEKAKNVIGIISIKGGVGKTNCALNISCALTHLGKKVLLIDSDLSSPSIASYFGLSKFTAGIHDVIEKELEVKKAIYEHETGLHILPGILRSYAYRNKLWANPFLLKQKIDHLKEHYDHIIIDSSPSLNDEMLATIIASDRLFVVTTPDPVTLHSTAYAIKAAKEKKREITGLILNRVSNNNFELGKDIIEGIAGVPIIGTIREDKKVMKALAENMPVYLHAPNSRISLQYRELASKIADIPYKPTITEKMMSIFS